MVRSQMMKDTLDDGMMALPIFDFTGGLNAEADPQDLKPNQSPDCQNVRFRPGRLIGRPGWISRNASLPAAADGVAYFYDTNGTRHLVVWANGNVYDMTDYTLTLVKASAYTAGYRIAWTILNKILYFSDGYTINGGSGGIRYYDPATSTTDTPLLTTSGTAGTIAPPACKCLTTYAGSLVMANLKYASGAPAAPHGVLWSNVNDPTTILGNNLFNVGQGFGGEINSIQPMGISSVGVTPFRALFLTKSEFGVYLLRGALSASTLEEVLINCPMGCLDGATVQYIPGAQGGGGFMAFLATDRKVWWTDGITADELSEPIRKELSDAVSDRYSIASPNTPKFTSVRNDTDFMYMVDIGADASGNRIMYAYDWELKVWTRYKGWPSGYWVSGKTSDSQTVLYCATSSALAQANVGITDGGDGTADPVTGGATIVPYWKTGYLHAGDPDLYKIWKWCYIAFRTTEDGNVTIDARNRLGTGNTASATLTVTAAVTPDQALWDVALWDDSNWVLGSGTVLTPYKRRARLKIATSNLDGSYESLRGADVQVQISTTAKKPFEILGFELFFVPRGRRRVAS